MKFTMDVTTKKCLMRWNEYSDSVTVAVQSLRYHEELLDVTLACDGKTIRAHKLVLAACSQYFRQVFKEYPCEHPTIILDGISWKDLLGILQFVYCGLVLVEEEAVCSLLTAAYTLDIVGLNYVTEALLEDKYIYKKKTKEVEVVTKKRYDTFEEKTTCNETKLQGALNNLNAVNESRCKELSARNKAKFNLGTSSTEPNISNLNYNDRVPSDRVPSDRVPSDRVPSNRVPSDRVPSRSESSKHFRSTNVEFDSVDQPQLKKIKIDYENHSPEAEENQEEQDEELLNGSIYRGLRQSLEKLSNKRRLQDLERLDEDRRLDDDRRLDEDRRLERLDDDLRLKRLDDDRRLETLDDDRRLERLDDDLRLKRLDDDRRLERLGDDRRLETLDDDRRLETLDDDRRKRLDDDRRMERLDDDLRLKRLDDDRRLERLDDDRRLEELDDDRRLKRLDDDRRLEKVERPDDYRKLQNLEKELPEKKLVEEDLQRDSVWPCMMGIRGYPVVNGDGFPQSISKSYEDAESFSKSCEDDLNLYDNESSQDGSSMDNIDCDMGPAPLPFNHPAVLASSKSAAAAVSAAAAAALASAASNGGSISQMNYAAYLAANSRGMMHNSGMDSVSPHHNAPSPSGICLPVWMPPINSISPSPSPPPPGSGSFPPGFIRSSSMSQQDLQTTLEQYQRKLAFHEPRPCPTCQRMYRDAATLRTHIAIMHSEGKEPFTCTCGSVFKTKYDMYQHKKNGHR